MNRLLAFALVASIGNVPMAFAEESLLTSGARHVQQLAVSSAPSTAAAALPATAVVKPARKIAPAYQQTEAGTISKSGMKKSTKALIYSAIAVGFAASVWTIDHNVLDVTPSSLGTRQD